MADLRKYLAMQKRIDTLNSDKELHFEIVLFDMPEEGQATIQIAGTTTIMSIEDYKTQFKDDEQAGTIKQVICLS
jgi:predicted transcriptional regulator YheO